MAADSGIVGYRTAEMGDRGLCKIGPSGLAPGASRRLSSSSGVVSVSKAVDSESCRIGGAIGVVRLREDFVCNLFLQGDVLIGADLGDPSGSCLSGEISPALASVASMLLGAIGRVGVTTKLPLSYFGVSGKVVESPGDREAAATGEAARARSSSNG
jgi:hypothetical protein